MENKVGENLPVHSADVITGTRGNSGRVQSQKGEEDKRNNYESPRNQAIMNSVSHSKVVADAANKAQMLSSGRKELTILEAKEPNESDNIVGKNVPGKAGQRDIKNKNSSAVNTSSQPNHQGISCCMCC
ncbi:hypothetical protein KIN20_010554 [Parelaphostrongylus tenuis]|uniref:Uncharacterized protein n=1 Tax=Parelaphostrongylus tenuis TaxID=148309 RepID=A0AAD5M814_PARTN|nr:hypothetical protein KIN20_010554 [Parelaphostrongylus tenuis]